MTGSGIKALQERRSQRYELDNDGDDVLGAVWEAAGSQWGDHDPAC